MDRGSAATEDIAGHARYRDRATIGADAWREQAHLMPTEGSKLMAFGCVQRLDHAPGLSIRAHAMHAST
ncbi:hypothetical protein ASE35_14620 [Lysobacter sp. Root916]|nr:hypothetical protein ASE35_14620 [Lysobacter sp. Root916]